MDDSKPFVILIIIIVVIFIILFYSARHSIQTISGFYPYWGGKIYSPRYNRANFFGSGYAYIGPAITNPPLYNAGRNAAFSNGGTYQWGNRSY